MKLFSALIAGLVVLAVLFCVSDAGAWPWTPKPRPVVVVPTAPIVVAPACGPVQPCAPPACAPAAPIPPAPAACAPASCASCESGHAVARGHRVVNRLLHPLAGIRARIHARHAE
jgi:hypothetical protein